MPKRVHRNKYPQEQSGLFQGLVNRIKNGNCDQELLVQIVNTAAERGQIRPDEQEKLLKMIENKFKTDGNEEQDGASSGEIKAPADERKRRHRTHHKGSELAIRPMTSQARANIHGTGPLGVKDFHHGKQMHLHKGAQANKK